jgi:hypothetical protein
VIAIRRDPHAMITTVQRQKSAFRSLGFDQGLQRGEILGNGVGVALEVLIGHLRTLADGEDHLAPITVSDDP